MKQFRFLTAIHLFACVCFLLSGCTQDRDYTQWELPEGAKLRIGMGRMEDLKFSPDGELLAVATSVGIWLYDTENTATVDASDAPNSIDTEPTGSLPSMSLPITILMLLIGIVSIGLTMFSRRRDV